MWNCCHHIRFWAPKMLKNASAAGAPPRTPLGELTALPRPPIAGKGGGAPREGGGEGKEKEGRGGEGREGKGKGWKSWLRPCRWRQTLQRITRKRLCCTIPRGQFFIISYFGFRFTRAYNSILFCCLRHNVEPCCHTHDSRTTVTVYSARPRLFGLALHGHGRSDCL